MKKLILILLSLCVAVPALAKGDRNNSVSNIINEVVDEALEGLLDVPLSRAIELNCYSKSDLWDRIVRNDRYRRSKLRKKNIDLCRIEFDRIDSAEDAIEAASEILIIERRRARKPSREGLKKLLLARNAVVKSVAERVQRTGDLKCNRRNSNIDICRVENRSLLKVSNLVQDVNALLDDIYGLECYGTNACR